MINISDKFVENFKTRILCSITYFQKSCRFKENMETYGRKKQDADGNTKRHMHFTYGINKATDT